MKIHFNSRPDHSQRCLTERAVLLLEFKGSFHLNGSNIHVFITHHTGFDGKLAFSNDTGRLILSAGEDLTHEQIARSLEEGIAKTAVTAAFISFVKTAESLTFEIDGHSDNFPRPTMADKKQVAVMISGLLSTLGLSPQITELMPEERIVVRS